MASTEFRTIGDRQAAGCSRRKPFIVDMDASILRELGKHARALYNALRYMADGKTGELRFRERWYKAKEFDREAKMCERVRLAAMRELVAAGLVTYSRQRVWRMIDGRLRAVAGRVQYVVHRQPVPLKNRQKTRDSSKLHLQNCIPGSLLEMQSQTVPTPPTVAGGSVFPNSENRSARESAKPSSAPADDDFPAFTPKNSKAETARTLLLRKGHDPQMVDIAISRVADLAAAKKKIPRSPAYFVTSVERALADPEDRDEIEAILAQRAENRITSAAPLNPMEKHRASKIVMLHEVVEEAARIRRPACEVMRERLAPDAGAIARDSQIMKE